MMVSRRTYLLVSILGAVVSIGVAALATIAPWLLWLVGRPWRLPRCPRLAAPHPRLAITVTWQQGLAYRRRLSGLWRYL
jgi:hypothetical protein